MIYLSNGSSGLTETFCYNIKIEIILFLKNNCLFKNKKQ